MTPIGAAGSCGRLPDDRGDDAPACGSIAEFAQVDPLPRAQVDAPAADGKRESRPHERRFRMGGHVVVALVGVDVVGFAFADEAVEDRFQIGAHVGIGVLVEGQTGRGVLDEEVQQSRGGQRRKVRLDLVGDRVEAPAAGAEGEFDLAYHRCRMFLRCMISGAKIRFFPESPSPRLPFPVAAERKKRSDVIRFSRK